MYLNKNSENMLTIPELLNATLSFNITAYSRRWSFWELFSFLISATHIMLLSVKPSHRFWSHWQHFTERTQISHFPLKKLLCRDFWFSGNRSHLWKGYYSRLIIHCFSNKMYSVPTSGLSVLSITLGIP